VEADIIRVAQHGMSRVERLIVRFIESS
jgi:hypothetical protein